MSAPGPPPIVQHLGERARGSTIVHTARLALDLPADPIELGRRVADRPGAALLWDARPGGVAYLACDPVETFEAWDLEPSLPLARRGRSADVARSAEAEVPRWIGVLPYEAARDLERTAPDLRADPRALPLLAGPRWNRYAAVACVTDRVVVLADDDVSARELAGHLQGRARSAPSRLELAEPVEADEVHKDRIRCALDLIGRGELYQVNLARRFRLRAEGDLMGHLERLARRTRAPYCALLRLGATEVLSTSPELFLSLDGKGSLTTSPIKGTRPRGRML